MVNLLIVINILKKPIHSAERMFVMKKIFGILIGVLLVAAGLLFALDNLGIMQLDVTFEGWWTLFIIIPGLYGLVTSRDKIGNLIVLAIGVFLLLAARGVVEYGTLWQLVVPAIIVLIGIKLIIKAVHGDGDETDAFTGDMAVSTAVFNSQAKNYSGNSVKQAKVCAIFGGTKCNLSDVKFTGNSTMDLFCIFGGADVIIPENVEVKVNTLSLFGGVSDKRILRGNVEKTASLTINGFCLFGGADIK